MHAAFYRPGENYLNNLSLFLLEDIAYFINNAFTSINEINMLLVNNKIWKRRLIGIGQFNKNFALANNLTGVLLRSTGTPHDVRLNINDTYANYFYLNVKSYCGSNGDCYDRYLLRISEIIESLSLSNQCILKLKGKKTITDKYFLSNKDKVYQNMESLIKHFKS